MRQQLEALRQSCLEQIEVIDFLISQLPPSEEQPPLTGNVLLQTVEIVPDTFLEEINQPVKLASDEPEPTPDIPATEDLPESVDEKLENKEVLIEKFGLEEISTISDADWLRYAKTVMLAGWTVERLQASDSCKNVVFSKTETELLKNLEGLRFSMLEKDMDLNQALGQNWVGELERTIIKEFAKEKNLK